MPKGGVERRCNSSQLRQREMLKKAQPAYPVQFLRRTDTESNLMKDANLEVSCVRQHWSMPKSNPTPSFAVFPTTNDTRHLQHPYCKMSIHFRPTSNTSAFAGVELYRWVSNPLYYCSTYAYIQTNKSHPSSNLQPPHIHVLMSQSDHKDYHVPPICPSAALRFKARHVHCPQALGISILLCLYVHIWRCPWIFIHSTFHTSTSIEYVADRPNDQVCLEIIFDLIYENRHWANISSSATEVIHLGENSIPSWDYAHSRNITSQSQQELLKHVLLSTFVNEYQAQKQQPKFTANVYSSTETRQTIQFSHHNTNQIRLPNPLSHHSFHPYYTPLIFCNNTRFRQPAKLKATIQHQYKSIKMTFELPTSFRLYHDCVDQQICTFFTPLQALRRSSNSGL